MSETPEKIRLGKALSYANGYRELGMYADALRELDALPKEQHTYEPVLQMKLAITMDSQAWVQAQQIAKKLLEHDPTVSGNYVNLAYVTRRADSMEKGKWILLEAVSKFPHEAIIHYNLGCYECKAGDFEEAKSRLLVAFSLDAKYMKIASKDSDLESMKNWLAGLGKKKKG